MNKDFAELLGMHAGDGSLYKTNTGVVWELRGGLDEKELYNKKVKNLIKLCFNEEIEPRKRSGGKNGCYGVRSSKKKITNQISSFFPIGKKSKIVSIPSKINLSKNIRIKNAFLKGLFATDGTAYLARINKQLTPTYPIIEFATNSQILRNQVYEILYIQEFKPSIWTYTSKKENEKPMYHLRLSGKNKTKRFIKITGLGNPKHQKRLNRACCKIHKLVYCLEEE